MRSIQMRSTLVDHRRAATVVVAAGAVAWIGVAGWLARNERASAAIPIGCPVKALTGLDCPGCGSTRSLGALTQLDLAAALDHNVLVPFALVFVVASFAVWSRAIWSIQQHDDGGARASQPLAATDVVRRPEWVIGIAVVIAGFTLLRNVEAGTWLASELASTTRT